MVVRNAEVDSFRHARRSSTRSAMSCGEIVYTFVRQSNSQLPLRRVHCTHREHRITRKRDGEVAPNTICDDIRHAPKRERQGGLDDDRDNAGIRLRALAGHTYLTPDVEDAPADEGRRDDVERQYERVPRGHELRGCPRVVVPVWSAGFD